MLGFTYYLMLHTQNQKLMTLFLKILPLHDM